MTNREFRLNKVDKTRNYLLKEIKHNLISKIKNKSITHNILRIQDDDYIFTVSFNYVFSINNLPNTKCGVYDINLDEKSKGIHWVSYLLTEMQLNTLILL